VAILVQPIGEACVILSRLFSFINRMGILKGEVPSLS
jgi:hypothetical protein